MSEMPSRSTITFTYRDVFRLHMSNSVFMVPFDVQTLIVKMFIRTIESSKTVRGKKCILRFNIMDHGNDLLKFSVNRLDDMG